MADINPLALIGKSNIAPDEPGRKAAADLQRGLGMITLQDRGAMDRTKATNASNELRALAALGLTPGDPNNPFKLEQNRQALNFSKIGPGAAALQTSGLYPTLGDTTTVGDLPKAVLRLGETSGEKMEKAKKQVIINQGSKKITGGYRLPNGANIGLQKWTEEEDERTKAIQKNTPRAKKASDSIFDAATVQRLKKFMAVKFPGVKYSEPYTKPNGGIYIQLEDGKEYRVQ